MLQRAASNAYSWWWASHIRTKQSKWLDNNLQDMEDRVQSMLKIIEEDADSFARRAEMYYKRRPELINCVEESYRAYRALAERYDHISGELHKANHTIATAFPDQVHYEMNDEDDDGSPTAISPIDSAKIPKPPAEIPQISFRNKTRKIQSALKKPQHRRINSAEKSEAQEEIDRLYKRILVLQTEKEFIKSSYESGLARYWEIEKQVAEMQGEVCCLQDEFSANAFIEDDEARALMAATALKSCEDTLVNLQEQQKRSSELARIESKRIQDAGERLRALKGESVQTQMENGELSCENADASILISCMEEEVYGLNQERLELESLSEKVREHFDVNSDTSVVEVAEKINELVNKVIGLETTVSSQIVQIDRLRSETDELQKHLQSLEEEKLTLIGDSNILGDKLRQAEEELRRIQNIEKSVQDEKKILHTHFAEACHSLNDLSEKLHSPKHQDVISSARAFQDEDISPLKSLRELKEREDIGPQDTKDSSADEWACHVQEPGVCLKELDDHVQAKTDSTLEYDSEKLRSPKEEVLAIQDQKDNIVEEEVHSIRAHVSWLEDKGIHAQSEIERQLKKDPNQEEEVTTIKDTGDTLIKEETRMTQEPDLGDKIQENDIQAITGSQLKTVSEQSKYLEKEDAEIQDREEHLSEEKDLVMSEHGLSLKDEENVHKAESKNELDSDFFKDPKQENHFEEKDSLQEDDNNHPSNEPPAQQRDQDCTLNLQQLLLNGLEGREKILLSEYTSILRNYKEAKKRLSEAERMNEEYRFETMAQIGELKRANAMKDEEIRFLGQKLSSLQGDPIENPSAPLLEAGDPSYRKLESKSSFPRLMAVSSSSRRLFSRSLKGINRESKARTNASFDVGETENPLAEDGIKLVHIGEPHATSALEEKFRRHIDTLLEENLEFWLRFSTTFHYVQKFQTTFEDLQEEIKKLKDSMTQEGSSSSGLEHAIKPETAPIDKQLRELKTELQVWLEQNVMLREELQKRLASLCDIQDEISAVLRSSKAEEFQFTPYQAAKFQGEVLNMQQENNKVADELKVGLDHVKALQVEVEKALSKLHESFELHGSRSSRPHNHFRHFSHRTRIPLRSFLFGTKPKKPSIFSCASPPLQKRCSDLRAASLPT